MRENAGMNTTDTQQQHSTRTDTNEIYCPILKKLGPLFNIDPSLKLRIW